MDSRRRGLIFAGDIETGGVNKRRGAGVGSVEELFKASEGNFQQSRFFQQHFDRTGRAFPLMEVFMQRDLTNEVPFFQPGQWAGLKSTESVFLRPPAGSPVSPFAWQHGIAQRSLKHGLAGVSEEQVVGGFFERMDSLTQQHGHVTFTGWNGVYDLSFFEAAAHRHDSLKPYRGWFAKNAKANRFSYEGAEQPFLQAAYLFGQHNPVWKNKYLRQSGTGQVVQSFEDMYRVPGWSLERVAKPFGGLEKLVGAGRNAAPGMAHAAFVDTPGAAVMYQTFGHVTERLKANASFEEAFAGLEHLHGRDPEQLFSSIYSTPWRTRLLEQERLGRAQLERGISSIRESGLSWKKPALVLGGIGVAALAYGFAFGKRRDRQTQIEGLRHAGMAGASRRESTDFGSGWQGIDEDTRSHKANWMIAGAAGAYVAHRWRLAKNPNYAHKVYSTLRTAENLSPRRVLATLDLSHRSSVYSGPDDIKLGAKELFSYLDKDVYGKTTSASTRMGSHLERLTGVDLAAEFTRNPNAELSFKRGTGFRSGYRQLHIDGKAQPQWVSFAQRGKLTDTSERYGAKFVGAAGEEWERGVKWVDGAGRKSTFVPLHSFTEGEWAQNIGSRAARETFSYADRLNRSLEEFHLNVPHSSYADSWGLVGRLLATRVLPIAIGLTVAKYADYKLNHAPSDLAWSMVLKARVARAEATDKLPGARSITDWYADHVPGAQYAPLALPALGAFAGGIAHYAQVLNTGGKLERAGQLKKFGLLGALVGGALALPFLPGMLGSRKTADELRDEFSGHTPVQIRAGRWWNFGTSSVEGNRIIETRPHAYALHKSRAEDISLYGSEEEKWAHNPLLHPIRWFKDPNWLARKHEADRPYPITSPAFSNVPLIGPLLAATIGKVVAPPKRMHEEEWDGSDYTLYTKAVEPKSPRALAPDTPHEEFGIKHVWHRAQETFFEAVGAPGFLMKTAKKKFGRPTDNRPDVYFEGTRGMTDVSRRYSELEWGGLPGYHPKTGITSFTEPIRRFLNPEHGAPRANELQNQMPSWLPNGDQYFIDFHKGDIYSRLPHGAARLPGAGYAALHPEVEGLDPEEYPDIEKLRILGDVAPYSRNFKQMAAKVGGKVEGDTAARIEYEKILDLAREARESTVRFSQRHTGPVDELEGTVRAVSDKGIRLEEYPGRMFSFSGVGGSAANLSSIALGNSNAEIAADVERRQAGRGEYLSEALAPGTSVRLVVPRGAADTQYSRAVVFANDENINQQLIEQGYGSIDRERSGAEAQAMDGPLGKLMRNYAEGVSFAGDESVLNPLRYLPRSMHAKLWNERTALETYTNQEVSGTRMRRWQRPLHDFAGPYFRGIAKRLTGNTIIPEETQERRDLDTLADQLEYLRSLYGMGSDPQNRGLWSQQAQRTSIGANLFGETDRLPQTLPGRERKFFESFLRETDPEKRGRILAVTSKEMADTLVAQWTQQANRIRQAAGTSVEEFNFSGRYVSQEDINRVTDLEGKVTRVIDGDSIVVDVGKTGRQTRGVTKQGEREIRLANVNAPEMSSYAGHISKDMTTKLALGKNVRLHTVGEDKYGRTVADVFTDEKRLLNFELLNSGHAQKDVYENLDGSNQTGLSIGDYFRAREVAQFFKRRGLHLPDPDSEPVAADIDYEDVKAKIVQWEGLDSHDFNIYDDRMAMLWRKPYLDGAVRELTSGEKRSTDELTMAIEQALVRSKQSAVAPRIRAQETRAQQPMSNVRVDVDIQPDEELRREVRRNREDYQ